MSEVNSKIIPNTGLEKAIFATIAYYDYFNYPLTAGEIYQYLIRINPKFQFSNSNQIPNSNFQTNTKNTSQDEKPKLGEIIEILDDNENLARVIEQKNGFYFLRGREEIIKQRIQKKKLMDQKYKKVKWILRFISFLPFVRLIMLSGSMGLGNPLKESDIDLLVIAKHGRIWTTRAILTFFTLLFGAYRHTGKTQNRLCLNHYITDKSLRIDFGNLYKAQEYLNLLPLSGDLEIYQRFFKENSWIKDYVYSDEGSLEKNLRTAPLKGIPLKTKNFFEFLLSGAIGNYFEKYVKKFQVYFIEKNPLTKSPHARIRYNDENLVFHPVLVEPQVIGQWKEKIDRFTA